MAHTAQIAAETIATDNNGSYTTVAPGTLAAIDASVRTVAGSPPEAVRECRERDRRQLDRDRHLLDREHVLDRQGDRHGRSDVSLHRFRDRQRWLSEQRLLGLTQLASLREARGSLTRGEGGPSGPPSSFVWTLIHPARPLRLIRSASSPTPGYGRVHAGCRFKRRKGNSQGLGVKGKLVARRGRKANGALREISEPAGLPPGLKTPRRHGALAATEPRRFKCC